MLVAIIVAIEDVDLRDAAGDDARNADSRMSRSTSGVMRGQRGTEPHAGAPAGDHQQQELQRARPTQTPQASA